MTDIKIDVEGKLEKLIRAGLDAYDLLLQEVKRPVDPDLPDDKSRNAMKAKKECFMDAKEILTSINKIKQGLDGEEEITIEDKKEEESFKAGFSEKFAKK